MNRQLKLVPWIGLVLDQVLKQFTDGQKLINAGIAFGFDLGLKLTIVIGLGLIIYLSQQKKDWPMGMLVMGGISNLIDRLRWGGVVDYWQLQGISFNLADTMIVVGALLLMLDRVYGSKKSF